MFLLILLGQWYRVARLEHDDPLYGPIARRYTLLLGVMTVWLASSIFVPADLRVWMWGGFLAIYLIGMLITALVPRPDADGARQSADPMATESLLERYGLFMIIVLGEVVASVVAGLGAVEELTARVFLTGFAGLAVGIAFWWTYFDMVGMRPPRSATRDAYLYTLAQLPLTLAITGVGAATVSLIEHTESADPAASWTFAGFVALAMLSLGAPALVLTGVLFMAMCGQWLYAVRGWLRTRRARSRWTRPTVRTSPSRLAATGAG